MNAYEDDHMSPEVALEQSKEAVKMMKLHPWCGLCGSTDLQYEDRPTRFANMQEAAPYLAAAHDANQVARDFFRHLPKDN